MRAAISVIVTTRNAAGDLPDLVPLIFEAVQEGILRELIFADAGSTDDTARIAEAIGAEVVAGGRAEAAEAAQGDWLLFLDQTDRPETGWTRAAGAHLEGAGGAPGVFRQGRLADLWARLRGAGPDRAVLIRAADARAGHSGPARVWAAANRPVRRRKA